VMFGDVPLAHQEERLDEERPLHACAEGGHKRQPNGEGEKTHENEWVCEGAYHRRSLPGDQSFLH